MADFDGVSRDVDAVLERHELLQVRDGHQSRTLQIPSIAAVVVIVVVVIVVGTVIAVVGIIVRVAGVQVRGIRHG